MAAEAKKEATAQAPEAAKAKDKYVVIQEFRDITNFNKIHKVGDNVSSMDEGRLTELVEGGLVEKK